MARSPQGTLGPQAAARYRTIDNRAATFHLGTGAGPGVSSTSTPVNPDNVPGERGFVGMTGADQAAANGGLDLEPPDQGLCAGQGVIGEFINNAFAVYSPTGVELASPIPSYRIFRQPSTAFMSDPRCYYDRATQRWFLAEFIVGTINASGMATSPSVQFLAVSDTSNVLGKYHILSIDTTDKSTKGCPCFGDFDQLGADANGMYITTNEFSIAPTGPFNGVIIYALSKELFESEPSTGIPPTVFTYRLKADGFGQPYHVSPATTPPTAAFSPNTEYFVESNSDANSGKALEVYALTGTSDLAAPAPPPLKVSPLVPSQSYAFPPPATQMRGPIPLGRAVAGPQGRLQADFNAIQEVTDTGGRLYAELDTATAAGTDGVAWFVLTPAISGGKLTAKVSSQGYVSAPRSNNLLYPVIAINADGSGYLAFTLSGPDYYPSAAYEAFGAKGPTGPIRIAQAGEVPEDSFTCYAAYVGPSYGGCRWGDYSMGVALGANIVLATELVPPTSRDYLTNWGTFVWSAPAPS